MQLISIEQCPICGGGSMLIASVKTIARRADVIAQLRCCIVCGHWWHSPIPSQHELSALYQAASPFVVTDGAKEAYQVKRIDGFHKFVMDYVSRKKGAGNYLEIGAGGGHLLNDFRRLGYNTYGVDPAQWVEDKDIYPTLNDVPVELDFTVFVLQDVLEHIANPIETLSCLRKRAADGALLFCSFPCNESRPARRDREKWSMVLPYGHLHYFSYQSATKMLEQAGWKLMQQRMASTVSMSAIFRERNWRALAYELVKGSKDQLYLVARAS